jgi:hypothetical protein
LTQTPANNAFKTTFYKEPNVKPLATSVTTKIYLQPANLAPETLQTAPPATKTTAKTASLLTTCKEPNANQIATSATSVSNKSKATFAALAAKAA